MLKMARPEFTPEFSEFAVNHVKSGLMIENYPTRLYFFIAPTLNPQSIPKKRNLPPPDLLRGPGWWFYAAASVRPNCRPCFSRARPYARTRQTEAAPAAKASAYEISVSMGDVGYMAPSSGQDRIVEHHGRSAPNPLFQLVSQGICRRSHRGRHLVPGTGTCAFLHREELVDHALRFLI